MTHYRYFLDIGEWKISIAEENTNQEVNLNGNFMFEAITKVASKGSQHEAGPIESILIRRKFIGLFYIFLI